MASSSISVDGADGDALRRAKALAVPTRVALLDLLRAAGQPLTAAAMASELGVHHTAVRQHMVVLQKADLVEAHSLAPLGRGRPRMGYTASAQADAYRELATALAQAIGDGVTAREIGRRRGRAVTPSPDGVVATLCQEADRLGFQPKVKAGASRPRRHLVVLATCPFAAAAEVASSTVCELHLGLAEGIAERVGGATIEELRVVDPQKGGCCIVVTDA
ncbi:MAG: helix-turn-helix domain-containing protein [Actinomycetota bacterium]